YHPPPSDTRRPARRPPARGRPGPVGEPGLGAKARAIIEAVMYGLTDVPPAPIHGDLKADHIFLAPGLVTFIDLDSAALGDPVRDPAHLFAYLAAGVGLDSMPTTWLSAATVFAAEYFQHVPAAWR